MSMNPDHQDYTSPTRLDRITVRKHNETCGDNLTSALEHINLISSAGHPTSHADPLEHVGNLNALSEKLFTDIPAELVEIKGTKNKLLINARNKEQSPARRASALTVHSAPLKELVQVEKKLPLSWDARRIANTLPKSNTTSNYAGLFTQNAAINPGVEQGPIPEDLTKPRETNRRIIVARKAEARAKANIVVDRSRKARILQHKRPNLLKKTVPKDFVPAAGASPTKGDRRQEVAEKLETQSSMRKSNKAFK